MATGDRYRDRETATSGDAAGDADEGRAADHPPLGVAAALVARLRADFPAVAAVGVGAAGLVDRDGDVQYAPNIPAFRRTPLREALGAAIGLPVVVDNDANAAAWGEIVHGAARGALYALM